MNVSRLTIMSSTNVFIFPEVPDSEKKRLKDSLPESSLFFRQDYDDMEAKQLFLECNVLFGNPPPDWIEASGQLKWVQLESAGLDPFQEIIAQGQIRFSNLRDFFSRPVAETALAGILALYRNVHVLVRSAQQRKWDYDSIRPAGEMVEGKNILILGPGSIGKMIEKLLTSLGGQVRMFGSRSDLSGPLDKLDELLSTTDILVGSLPESETTIGLMNEKRLGLLSDQAIVINVGRGSLIDETVLIRLLRENKLRGAFLDVTWEEPIPKESELWEVPNLILGQHAGGGMPNELGRKIDYFIQNYQAFKNGKPANLVPPSA